MLLLSKDDIEKGLSSLYAWEYNNKSIRKTYSFNAYTDGINFVNKIAEIFIPGQNAEIFIPS